MTKENKDCVKKGLISIIIPAHNEEKYIKKTLNRIKDSTYQDYEVIVVANGCNDSTESLVKKFFKKNINYFNSSFKSLSTANVSKARNYGAKHSKGEILIFLDADILISKDTLEKIVLKFTKEYSLGATRFIPDTNKVIYWIIAKWHDFLHRTNIYKGFNGVVICHRDDFFKYGKFNEEKEILELKDFKKRLVKRGKYIVIPTNTIVSMRRYERWGLFSSIGFWIKQWLKKQKEKYEVIR